MPPHAMSAFAGTFTPLPRARRRSVSRRASRWRSSAGPSLPSSVAVTRDPASGATVYVVGCVHGSRVSADDVRATLSAAGAGVVVLELCEARLRSLRRDMQRQRGEHVPAEPGEPHSYHGERPARPLAAFRASTARFGGVGPAALATLLSAVYRLQRAVGVDPGAEFKTAVELVDDAGGSVVCGDAPAVSTVRNLFRAFLDPGGAALRAAQTVVAVCDRLVHPPKSGIRVFSVLREGRRAKELARIMVPLLVIVTALSAASSSGAAGIEEGLRAGSGLSFSDQAEGAFSVGKAILDTYITSYLIVSSLEFFRVLIADRDAVLCRSIRDAARQATEAGPGGSVVAVVGMMHVNGVVKYLESEDSDF